MQNGVPFIRLFTQLYFSFLKVIAHLEVDIGLLGLMSSNWISRF